MGYIIMILLWVGMPSRPAKRCVALMYEDFAAIYDPLMRDVDYDGWANYIAGFLPEGRLSIADCACGTGNIALRLARLGHSVTGLDLSPDMLRIAAEKARQAGLRVPFVCEDMRALSLHRPVDVVTACCDGVNYLASLEDVSRFFLAAREALKPGGLLLFDVSSEYKLSRVLGNNTFAEDDGERAYIWQNSYDDNTRLVSMELSFFVKEGALYRRFTEEHTQRAHSEAELLALLSDAGYEASAYDAFTKDPTREESERIQFAAKKL